MRLAQGRDGGRVAATPLSRSTPGVPRIWAVSRLAWRSLMAVSSMVLTQSCIVADPPEYKDPVRTRPFLDVYKAVPLTQNVLVVYTKDPLLMSGTIVISVPVRSEDAGEDLNGHFFIDYGVPPPQEKKLVTVLIPASTYDVTSRSAHWDWQPKANPPSDGCHVLTLVVAHKSSFKSGDQDHLDPAMASEDAAIVSWWVNVNPLPGMAQTLSNCPTPGLP